MSDVNTILSQGFPVSVLMSVYKNDKEYHFALALRSILEQSLMPAEVVIVLDGPVVFDVEALVAEVVDSAKVVVKIVRLPENRGLGFALKVGLEVVSNELVARMDADDIAFPNRLQLQVGRFSMDDDLAVLGGQVREFVGNIEAITGRRCVPTSNSEIARFLELGNPFNHMSVMFRRSIVSAVGGYEDCRFYEDYLLWFKIVKAGYKCANLAQDLVYVRAGRDQLSRRRGLRLLKCEWRFQILLLRRCYISRIKLLRNMLFRGVPRVLPLIMFRIAYSVSRRRWF